MNLTTSGGTAGPPTTEHQPQTWRNNSGLHHTYHNYNNYGQCHTVSVRNDSRQVNIEQVESVSSHVNVVKPNWCSISESRYTQKNSMSSLLWRQLSTSFSDPMPLIENVLSLLQSALLLCQLLSNFFMPSPIIAIFENKKCGVGKKGVTMLVESLMLHKIPFMVKGKRWAEQAKQGLGGPCSAEK